MSFLGFGHVRHYTDAEWPAVKAALASANIDAATGSLFTETQHAVALLLQNDPLVALAEKAIADVTASNVPILERLATAAADVGPGLVAWYESGGVTKTVAEVTSLATTFTQEVFNAKNSTSIASAVADVEAVVKKLGA